MSAIVIFTPLSKSSSHFLDEMRGAGVAKRIEAKQNDADDPSAMRFDCTALYGDSGEPEASDICQGIAAGFQLAVFAAIAERTPEQIKHAIQFDQNRVAFLVNVENEVGVQKTVEVTQADVAERLRPPGANAEENRRAEPLWPIVMETAYARAASNHDIDRPQSLLFELLPQKAKQ